MIPGTPCTSCGSRTRPRRPESSQSPPTFITHIEENFNRTVAARPKSAVPARPYTDGSEKDPVFVESQVSLHDAAWEGARMSGAKVLLALAALAGVAHAEPKFEYGSADDLKDVKKVEWKA